MRRYTNFPDLSTRRSQRRLSSLKLLLAIMLLSLPLCACAGSEPPAPSLESEDPNTLLWPHEEKAIQIQVLADRDLNVYDSRPHSLQMCVYQLDNPDPFLDLAKTEAGILILLKAEAFDQSVKSVSRIFMQPLEENTFHLDRAENAHFIGIVCGYFDSTPENCAKLWEIQPQASTSGFIWKTTTYRAGSLNIDLHLTDRAMLERNRQDQDAE